MLWHMRRQGSAELWRPVCIKCNSLTLVGNAPCALLRSSQHAKFVVCGLKRRNIGALLNHSCDPNVFVQVCCWVQGRALLLPLPLCCCCCSQWVALHVASCSKHGQQS